MGYGFSLPNNPADHFSIGLSPAISTYIKDIKALRTALHSDSEPRSGLSPSHHKMAATRAIEDTADGSGCPPESVNILVTEDSVEREIHWVRLTKDGFEFSPQFLADLSIAVESPRERRRKANMRPSSSLSFENASLSRNKLHVMCAIVMMLQKGQASMRKHDKDLPEQPEDSKQIDGARYRQSQLRILDHVLGSLYPNLRFHLYDSVRNRQVVRLEHTFEDIPKTFSKDYRNVLYAGMKTRDPRKMRDRGGVDFAFTIWLCGLWTYAEGSQGTDDEFVALGSAFNGHLLRWLRFLREIYPEQSNESEGRPQDSERIMGGSDWFDPIRSNKSDKDAEGDLSFVAASYFSAIQADMVKHPHSLYNNPRVTAQRLEWCLNIVRMEGVWYPNLQDDTQDEDDEWILFMETGDTVGSSTAGSRKEAF